MPITTHTIDLQDQDAGTLNADQNDKITWHNSTSSDITLNPPDCVSPQQATDIPAGQTSRDFAVTGQKGQSYEYSFTVGAELGTRNGTIDVNN